MMKKYLSGAHSATTPRPTPDIAPVAAMAPIEEHNPGDDEDPGDSSNDEDLFVDALNILSQKSTHNQESDPTTNNKDPPSDDNNSIKIRITNNNNNKTNNNGRKTTGGKTMPSPAMSKLKTKTKSKAKTKTKTKRKGKNARSPWGLYVYRIFRSEFPRDNKIRNISMSKKVMDIMNNVVEDVISTVMDQAKEMRQSQGRPTLMLNDIKAAVNMTMPRELAQHAINRSEMALTQYRTSM